MSRGHQKPRETTLILIVLVAFCSIYSNWLPIQKVPASDFYQFWVVGQELAAGQPVDIYSDLERRRIGRQYLDRARVADDRTAMQAARQRVVLETYSTPFLYTVFGSLSTSDYAHDLFAYRMLSLSLTALSVAVLCQLLGYGAISTFAVIALFGSWFAPVRSDLLVGNVNSIQLSCIVLFVWISCRFPTRLGYVCGGLLLGLSAMFKPNSTVVILALLFAWMMRRRHEKIVFASAGIAAAALVAFAWSSAVFDNVSIWQSWLVVLSELPHDIISVELGNYAPSRLVSEWMNVDVTVPITILCAGLAGAAIGWGLWKGAPEEACDRPGFEDLHVVAVAGLTTLLVSPLSWLHYFVAAIPMLLIALRPAAQPDLSGGAWFVSRGLACVALLAVMMRPLVILEVGNDYGRAVFLCVGTTLLFGLGLRSLLAFRTESMIARDGV